MLLSQTKRYHSILGMKLILGNLNTMLQGCRQKFLTHGNYQFSGGFRRVHY